MEGGLASRRIFCVGESLCLSFQPCLTGYSQRCIGGGCLGQQGEVQVGPLALPNFLIIKEVVNFLHTTQPLRVIPCLEDKLVMKESRIGTYSIKSIYELLSQAFIVPFLI